MYNDIMFCFKHLHLRSSERHFFSTGINSRKFASDENFEYIDPSKRLTVGSVGTSYPQFNLDHRGPQRALINPFRPSAIPCKWTCNRHRWSDAFPKGPEGDPLFRHHTKIHLGEIEEKEAPIQVSSQGSRG